MHMFLPIRSLAPIVCLERSGPGTETRHQFIGTSGPDYRRIYLAIPSFICLQYLLVPENQPKTLLQAKLAFLRTCCCIHDAHPGWDFVSLPARQAYPLLSADEFTRQL